MSGVLVVTPSRCIDCGKCMLACSLHHTRSLDPARSRLKVVPRGKEQGIPVFCLHCDDAACLKACPVGAISRNEATDAVVIDAARCVRCKACLAACPFGNVTWDATASCVVKCNLCDGFPMCATFCPSGALARLEGPVPLRGAAAGVGRGA